MSEEKTLVGNGNDMKGAQNAKMGRWKRVLLGRETTCTQVGELFFPDNDLRLSERGGGTGPWSGMEEARRRKEGSRTGFRRRSLYGRVKKL